MIARHQYEVHTGNLQPARSQPDGWWAPHLEIDSSEGLGSTSLVGSFQMYPAENPEERDGTQGAHMRGRPQAVGRPRK